MKNLKRYWSYYVFIFITPLVYNKMGLEGGVMDNNMLTPYFILLYGFTAVFMLIVAFMISFFVRYWYKNVALFSSSLLYLVIYYTVSVVSGLVLLAAFTAIWYWSEPLFWEIMLAHLKWRFSIFIIAAFAFSYHLKRFPIINWLGHTEFNPSSIIDTGADTPKLVLFSIYDYLYLEGLGPIYNDVGYFRFCDIVYIKAISKNAFIYLVDGTCVECKNILKILAELGRSEWVVKISQNYHFNMMHAYYPTERDGNKLVLQPKTEQSLINGGIQTAGIALATLLGPRIGNKNIDNFLRMRSDLTYDNLKAFVPIEKKS